MNMTCLGLLYDVTVAMQASHVPLYALCKMTIESILQTKAPFMFILGYSQHCQTIEIPLLS